MQYTRVVISLDYTYTIIYFNDVQRVRVWFRYVRTKIAKKRKPIIQKRGNFEVNFKHNELHTLLVIFFIIVTNRKAYQL